jgi:alpha-tubulin suppressor-like RCC1 family protein
MVTPKCFNYPNKISEFFCFEENICLCFDCAFFQHKEHDCVKIKEAIKRIQKELGFFKVNEEIQIIQQSLRKLNQDISKRNKQYEDDLKKLKEIYSTEMNQFEESNFKMKEKLKEMVELKENLKSEDIQILLKIKNVIGAIPEEYEEIYSFGCDKYGQLGLGYNENESTPQRITSFWNSNEKIVNVSCGGEHTIVVTSMGKYY